MAEQFEHFEPRETECSHLHEKIAKLEAELAEEREQRRLLMDDNRKLLMGNFEVIKENQKLRDWIGSALDRFPEIELDMNNPLEDE